MKRISLTLLAVFVLGCDSPPVENLYRKERRFPGGLNVPVALIAAEWGGKPRVMGSAWLIDGGRGTLFTAKHVTDTFMNNTIELGANECKVFLNGKVYGCVVVQVPPLRDAVVLKIIGSFGLAELPTSYKISTTKLDVGDKIYIQGFHPHPSEITKSNRADGLEDLVVPILETFYELREADPSRQKEIVFDNLEGKRVKSDPDSIRNNLFLDGEQKKALLQYENNSYIKVVTIRDHKFSFGGLSGGVALNEKGEAVGIITAQDPFRLEFDKDGFFFDPFGGGLMVTVKKQHFDIIYVTPIESVKDLYDYARQVR